MTEVEGAFYYYVNDSSTPMEDNLLQCPFDNPICFNKNITSGSLKGFTCKVKNGRFDTRVNYNESTWDLEQTSAVLDSMGLLCMRHESEMVNFWDEDELTSTHYRELKELTLSLTGADRIAVAAHALRVQGPRTGDRLAISRPSARDAAFTVHNDFSVELKQQFLDMHAAGITTIITDSIEAGGLGLTDIEDLRQGRLSVINYWRPMCTTPLLRNPLAVLDATSMHCDGTRDDVVLCRHPAKKENDSFLKHYKLPVPFINTLLRPRPDHKWVHFPGMTRNEVLVFKNYDSKPAQSPAGPLEGVGAGMGMHTSFDSPDTPSDAPPRESVEVRVVCFWFNDPNDIKHD